MLSSSTDHHHARIDVKPQQEIGEGRSTTNTTESAFSARSSHEALNDNVLHAQGVQTVARDDLSFEPSEDMRERMTIALDDHLHDHPDMAALYAQKLTMEGASPKPCIVPGNALQLIDDDPAASRSHTPSSVIVLDEDSHGAQEQSMDSSADQPERRPIPRVRFRSRVRITSGLRRSRHPGHPTSSPSSSASGSPSSSISAPIRWQADENGTWGPLGRRLSAYAHANGWQKRTGQQQVQPRSKMDERTPLIRSGRPNVAYVDAGLDGGGVADDERPLDGGLEDSDEETESEDALRAAALKREEEATFGQWPWRLFNRHWWWWQIEPVLCVCCTDESEFEE